MREILFKGKRKDNGEWVYGDLSQHKNGKRFIKCGNALQSYEVIPETVGQFTGLTDNNGKKIFEGDIVKNKYGNMETVQYYRGYYYPFVAFPEYKSWDEEECEVIENIHNNPELLK